jgi:hypothetical protein
LFIPLFTKTSATARERHYQTVQNIPIPRQASRRKTPILQNGAAWRQIKLRVFYRTLISVLQECLPSLFVLLKGL